MPRLRRWLVPFAALIAAASTRAGAEAAPRSLPDLSAPAPEVRAARDAQATTVLALVERDERRRARHWRPAASRAVPSVVSRLAKARLYGRYAAARHAGRSVAVRPHSIRARS